MKKRAALVFLFIALSACNAIPPARMIGQTESDMEQMMLRHMAALPDEYAGLSNPVVAQPESIERGRGIYATNCAACHGDDGAGTGPAAEGLTPAPAPLAQTAIMLSDAYLFYRVSAGGQLAPFNSAMPAFETLLSEADRWDVINYLRSLAGSNMMNGGPMMEGNMMNWTMAPWWVLGWILAIALVGMVIFTVAWIVRSRGGGLRAKHTPLEILKRRYAAGQIDEDQFERMKAQINDVSLK